MAATIWNLTTNNLALPAPFATVLAPRERRLFENVEWDEVLTDVRVRRLVDAGQIRFENSDASPTENTVDVAMSGTRYTSIQSAIDSIFDASVANPYVIRVAPGYYREAITLKDGVNLRGLGATPEEVRIGDVGATVVTWPAVIGGESAIANVTISTDYTGAAGFSAVVSEHGNHLIDHCNLQLRTAAAPLVGVHQTGDSDIEIRDCNVAYLCTGATAGVNDHVAVRFDAAGQIALHDSRFLMQSVDPDDNVFVIDESVSGAADLTVRNCEIIGFVSDPAYSGDVRGLDVMSAAVALAHEVLNCRILLANIGGGGAGTGYGIYIDTPAGTGNVSVSNSQLRIIGFGANYETYADVGDSVTLSFCLVDALDGTSGTGTIRNMVSDSLSNLLASGTTLSVPNLKSGVDQGAAGAAAGEMWVDTSAGNVIKRGV